MYGTENVYCITEATRAEAQVGAPIRLMQVPLT